MCENCKKYFKSEIIFFKKKRECISYFPSLLIFDNFLPITASRVHEVDFGWGASTDDVKPKNNYSPRNIRSLALATGLDQTSNSYA